MEYINLSRSQVTLFIGSYRQQIFYARRENSFQFTEEHLSYSLILSY